MKTWVKLYTEIIEDPDQGTLTLAQRGIWSLLLALCGRLDHRDDDGKETGELDTVDRIAWHLRCDQNDLAEALDCFVDRGMAEVNDGIVYLPNYGKRQGRPPSARKSAVAKRVQRHRANVKVACNEDVTTLPRGVTPSDTDTDTDTDTDKSADVTSWSSSDWMNVLDRAGIVVGGQMQHENWADLVTDAGGIERFESAVRIAVEQNKTSPAYIKGIIRNSLAEGHVPGPRGQPEPPKKIKRWATDPTTGKRIIVEAIA